MITPQEQEKVRFFSDNELYPQAVEFISKMGKTLPTTQINGLLNVSLANTYTHLQEFVNSQRSRTTWKRGDEHIPEFYRRLHLKLPQLKNHAQVILKLRTEHPLPEDVETLSMLIAREFIQHLLAENAYLGAARSFQQTERGNGTNQGRAQEPNRGPVRGNERT